MMSAKVCRANHHVDDHSALEQLLYQLSHYDNPITVPTDVLFWRILPNQIWKDVDVFRKIRSLQLKY